MSKNKRVLVLYYSLTGQTKMVLDEISDVLTASGHKVDMHRVEPVNDWTVPYDKFLFFYNWTKIWLGMNLTQPIQPLYLNKDDYDYILIGFQPWNLAPSMPINSFLDSPMANIFSGKKVIGIVTCRTRWERSYRIVKDKIARAGGELIDGLVIMNHEREPYNMITTTYYLFEGKNPPPSHWVAKYFKPYGINKKDVLPIVTDFAKDLAIRLSEDRLKDQKGWRVVNKPLSLI